MSGAQVFGLNAQQAQTLASIQRRMAGAKVSPSFDEIASDLGVTKSAVHRLVKQLVDRGYVRRMAGRSRTLQLIGPSADGAHEDMSQALSLAIATVEKLTDEVEYWRNRAVVLEKQVRAA